MVMGIVASCTYDRKEIPAPVVVVKSCDTTIHFAATIDPILQTYCVSCHKHGGTAAQFDYTSYAGIAAQASLIVQRITLPSGDIHHMPNDGTVLSDTDIQVLTCWVNQGFPNN